MPTFEATKAGYRALYERAQIKPERVAEALAAARAVAADKPTFLEVQRQTGVPWFMIGIILYRESGLRNGRLRLDTYLGNGQALNRVTTEVPANRGPFASFVLGAIDALVYQGYASIKTWILEHVLYGFEEFNGWGYVKHNENTPYLWAGTTLEQRGKFDRDGHYNPDLQDPQLGCVVVLKALATIDAEVAEFCKPVGAPVPAKPKEPTVATAPAPINFPALNIDWHLLLGGIENQLPTMLSSIPALAPYRDIIVSGAKILLHANPASMQGEALNLIIDQGLPLAAQFFPQIAPFVSIASMLAKMLLHAQPPALPTGITAAQQVAIGQQAPTPGA